jgi:hypothetical protein
MAFMRVLSSAHVYTNPWMTVREDVVLRQNGSTGRHAVVDGPDVARANAARSSWRPTSRQASRTDLALRTSSTSSAVGSRYLEAHTSDGVMFSESPRCHQDTGASLLVSERLLGYWVVGRQDLGRVGYGLGPWWLRLSETSGCLCGGEQPVGVSRPWVGGQQSDPAIAGPSRSDRDHNGWMSLWVGDEELEVVVAEVVDGDDRFGVVVVLRT